ncbi:MAG: hypothetical protein RMX68_030750 [Aulosira sp. ZfuVER01]|nr:hypothetical protein [Aulosira sp. ZfuVER01]MDZ7996859.1 hypothetical protein [Aulosira sp. DedVER01a]MDZ8049985.1 hypothetical protein [Aulosira sp. ZfuCHP01]
MLLQLKIKAINLEIQTSASFDLFKGEGQSDERSPLTKIKPSLNTDKEGLTAS